MNNPVHLVGQQIHQRNIITKCTDDKVILGSSLFLEFENFMFHLCFKFCGRINFLSKKLLFC